MLPTGFGKSLPYQMYLPVVRELGPQTERTCIIVCCPLVALMKDQVERLRSITELRIAYKGSIHEMSELINRGEFDILFASPESLVGDSKFRQLLQNFNVGMIVIDEFHTIATLGGNDDSDEYLVFRKWFRHVGELRSLFPSAPVLALSATCTNKIKKRVMKVMGLKENDTPQISISPNKPNIKLVVKKVSSEIETAIYWLVDALGSLEESFPRTLVYCNSISDVSKLYNHVVKELENCTNLVEMFHSETPEDKKEKIVSALRNKDSCVRIVIATSALGMGVDVLNCNSVVLYGPLRSVVDLVQAIGRVGRDGLPSVALIIYNSHHLRNVDKEVKTFISCQNCRRKELLKNLMSDTDILKFTDETCHTCCDLCAELCKCNHCSVLDIEKLFNNECLNCSSDSDDTIDYDWNVDELDMDFSLSDS